MRQRSAAIGIAVCGILAGLVALALPAGAISSAAFVDGAARGTLTPYGHVGGGCFDAFYTAGGGSHLVGLYITSTADCGDVVIYFGREQGDPVTFLVRPGADITIQHGELVGLGLDQETYTSAGGGGVFSSDPCTAFYWPAQYVVEGSSVTQANCG